VWPTISRSKTSKVLIASTPNGTDNLFYQLYDGAIKNQNDFSTMTIKWDAVPGRDEKWKQSQIKQIGSIEAFLQEYESCHGDTLLNIQKDRSSCMQINMEDLYKSM
jgi:hypothetical protein